MFKKKNTTKPKEKLIGRVIHYYDKLKVAVLKLDSLLKVGDEIRIEGGDVDFTQTVESMQFDHKDIKKAKAKEEVGIKVAQKVRDGYRVFKI